VLGTVFGWLVWRAGSVWPAVAAHAVNNGIASVLLLAVGPPVDPAPPPSAILSALALGGIALTLLLLAYAAAAPPGPAQGGEPVPLRDPEVPSIRFDPARVPRPLAACAVAGAAALFALAVVALGRGLGRSP
jgi:hypothetical protein